MCRKGVDYSNFQAITSGSTISNSQVFIHFVNNLCYFPPEVKMCTVSKNTLSHSSRSLLLHLHPFLKQHPLIMIMKSHSQRERWIVKYLLPFPLQAELNEESIRVRWLEQSKGVREKGRIFSSTCGTRTVQPLALLASTLPKEVASGS